MFSQIEKLEDDRKRLIHGRRVFGFAAAVCLVVMFASVVADLFGIGAGPHTMQIWIMFILAVLAIYRVISLGDDLGMVQRALISEYKAL